jgi:hypothetical protein
MNATLQREEDIFDAARNLPEPAARRAFLERSCGGDGALRARIERLLDAAAEADRFFAEGGTALSVGGAPLHPTHSRNGGDATATLPGEEKIGSRIGRYKLLKKIGEGGCGVVYMAEQEEPVRRRVALKIIKLGMETKSVIARFEAERQALAMMDHPNIARVFDAGATERGSPYFVMELVSGVKITDYCDHHRRPPTSRSVHPNLPRDPARTPKGRHSPRHQAVEHHRHPPRRHAGPQGDRFRHREGDRDAADG